VLSLVTLPHVALHYVVEIAPAEGVLHRFGNLHFERNDQSSVCFHLGSFCLEAESVGKIFSLTTAVLAIHALYNEKLF